MSPLVISTDHARRFLVRRHLLSPPRALPAKPSSVLRVVDTLGSLQFDPLEVPGARNHELVLHARIGGYQRGWCERWLYGPPEERRLFEAYNKSLNILPIDELPYFRAAWDRARLRYDPGIFRERAVAVADVLGRIERYGPATTSAFGRTPGKAVDWHWAPTSEGRAVLEALFEAGHVGIARRDGNRRHFDAIEKLLPAALLERRVTPDESLRHRVLSRVKAVGLLGTSASAEVFTHAGSAVERARAFAHLEATGVLVPVAIDGHRGHRYMLASDAKHFEAAKRASRLALQVTFVAPLDPIVWDRRLLASLFDFTYRWEVYTPAAKREHGYYALPILFGERFVGRIEPKLERARGVLHIAYVAFEQGFSSLEEPEFLRAFSRALEAYRAFVGAHEVTWARTKPVAALARAMQKLR